MRIESLNKPPHQRCVNQQGRGCAIYKDRPDECRVFTCGWLLGMIGKHLKPTRVHAVIHASELYARSGETAIKILRVTCDDRKKIHPDIDKLVRTASYRTPIVMEHKGFNDVWQKGKVIVRIREGEFFRFDPAPGGFFDNVEKVINDGSLEEVQEIPNWMDTRNIDKALLARVGNEE